MRYGRSCGDHLRRKEVTMVNDYGNMTMEELIESVIKDAIKAGCITYPLRTEGYHQASNLLYTERLNQGDVIK